MYPPLVQINSLIRIFLLYALLCCLIAWCRDIKTIHGDNEKEGKKYGFILRFTEFFLSFDFASGDHTSSHCILSDDGGRNKTTVFISLLLRSNCMCARPCLVHLLTLSSRSKTLCDSLPIHLTCSGPEGLLYSDLDCCSGRWSVSGTLALGRAGPI